MNQNSVDQTDPEFQNPDLCGSLNFATKTKLSFLELLSFSNSPEVYPKEDKVDKASLSDWLSKSLSNCPDYVGNSVISKHKLVGGLRLLYGECYSEDKIKNKMGLTLPIDPSSFALLEQSLGLPKDFQKCMKTYVSRNYKYTSQNEGGNTRTCYLFRFGMFQPSYYQLVLSYNPSTNITLGLLLSKTSSHKIPYIIKALKQQASNCAQPLLLATLMAELSIDHSADRIQDAELKLNELEVMLGQHEYPNMQRGRASEIDDFETATTSLNFHTQWLAVQSMRLGSVLLALETILFETKDIDKRRNKTVEKQSIGPSTLLMMEEFIAHLSNTAKNLLLRAEYENRRIGAQIQVVYHFMAHKNANVNIQLMKYSKDDSAAMRTMAEANQKDSFATTVLSIMGMLFLPGAFVAGIFAMPVFDWDEAGKPSLKAGFAYYMAVTVPLTFLVLTTWVFCMKIRPGKRRMKNDEE